MEYKKALVVDDSRAARFSLRKTLEKLNMQVDCVESGENAISYLRASNQSLPDIIFMDNLMPGMNGFNTSKAINEQPNWSHIPILMCSATEGPDSWPKAQQHGISGILSKPASVEDITQVMQTLFHVPVNIEKTESKVSSDKTQRQLQAFQQQLLSLSNQALVKYQEQLTEISSSAHGIANFNRTESSVETEGNNASTTSSVEILLDDFKSHTMQLLEERVQQSILRLQQELNDQLHQIKHQANQKQLQHQQLLEQVKNTAQFVATHHSIETAERIATETAHQLLQGELASMTEASKKQWETQIQTKFIQLQKRHTLGLYVSLAISVAALLVAIFI
jgi:CheY-like chemotaxis protein